MNKELELYKTNSLATHIRTNSRNQIYIADLYPLNKIKKLPNISQVKAIPFIDKEHVVLYKAFDGLYGLPGGRLEDGEDFETGLKRELIEEAQLKLLEFIPIAYEKRFYPNRKIKKQYRYGLRVAAIVELIDAKVADPDGEAVGREIVHIDELCRMLGDDCKAEAIEVLAREATDTLFPN